MSHLQDSAFLSRPDLTWLCRLEGRPATAVDELRANNTRVQQLPGGKQKYGFLTNICIHDKTILLSANTFEYSNVADKK